MHRISMFRRVMSVLVACLLAPSVWAQEQGADAPPPTNETVSEPPAVLDAPTTTTTTTTTPEAPALDPSEPPALPATTTTPTTTTPAARPFSFCVALAQNGSPPESLRSCLDEVISADPTSADAIRAEAARTMLDAVKNATPLSDAKPLFGAPGRLELIGVGGVFGVWNAIALGATAGATLQTDPGPTFLGTAGLALALGIGFGYAGHVIGDVGELDEGGGKLVASGLVWGSNVGIASAIWLTDIVRPQDGGQAALAIFGPIVTMGYVGGALGFTAAKLGKFDAAQVSLVNSGGAMGSFLGGMAALNMLQAQVEGAGPYALTYIAGNAVGLLGFGLLGNSLDLRWSETLIGDLGMVVGGTVGGLGMLGVLLTIGGSADGRVLTALMTSAASVGVVGGYAAGIGVALLLRDPNAPKDAPPAVALVPVTGAARDQAGRIIPTMGVMASF